jgi:C1A family cysteine protease
MVAYFEARALGRALNASPLFLYQTTLKLLRLTGNAYVDLRSTLKGLVRFGAPPEAHWPYDLSLFGQIPTDAFLYSFRRDFETIRYIRLDDPRDGEETLKVVRRFLSAGIPAAFGFPVPSSLNTDADVAFRPQFDSIRGGQAVLAVGYDDRRRIASDKGALLFRCSWGTQWGDHGYGWLPYAYVIHQSAVDFWTVLRAEWIASGAFLAP